MGKSTLRINWDINKQSATLYLVKVLHLVSIVEPRLFIVTRLNDKHLVVCKHLCKSVSEDLAHLDVKLMHLELVLITLKPRIFMAAGILSHLQLMHTNIQ